MINFHHNHLAAKSDLSKDSFFEEPQRITLANNTAQLKRLPQSIIIGARKCGTRALLKFLEINTNIRIVDNEVHFFDKPERYGKGLDWYREQMVESRGDQITIEKSPSYFVTNGVADKVAAMNNSIKLIVIFRNPIIRLISDFSQIVANKIEISADNETTKIDIEEAWREASHLFKHHLFRRDGTIRETWRAVQLGMYSKFLEKWLNVFPISQLHFVNGERLIKEPSNELKLVEQYLGIKPMIGREDFVFDQRKGFFCIAIKDNFPHGHSQLANENLQDNPKVNARCLSKHKGRRHITVDKETIDKLRQFYTPYNEYLFSLIGKQFDWSDQSYLA